MKTLFFFLFFIFLSFLPQVEAATISVDWPKEPVAPGSTLHVPLFLETDKAVNAVEGNLVLKGATLAKVEEAGSALVFWIKKPTLELKENAVYFSGVTPGGIPVGRHLLFKVTVKADTEGKITFLGSALQALLNDGAGTAETLSVKGNSLTVERGEVLVTPLEKKDTTPPESFSITESRSDDLADGKWFISFATVDKETGILGYKVKESIFPPYVWFLFSKEGEMRDVESPYILQSNKTYVLVRAVDLSGNQTDSFLSPQVPLFWYLSAGVLVMMGVMLFRVRRRKR